MAQIFKEISISVGFNIHQTIVSPPNAVVSENDAVRLLITFPDVYVDYVKAIDISYNTASAITATETYILVQTGSQYIFDIESKFTQSSHIKLQFRAYYTTGQEIADQTIINIVLRKNLSGPEYVESDVEYYFALEALVDAHAIIIASTGTLAHVKIDGETIVINGSGVISVNGIKTVDALPITPGDGDNISVLSTDGLLYFHTGTGWIVLNSAKGEQGDIGPSGPKGDTGATGPVGPKGDTGNTGDDGAEGSPGISIVWLGSFAIAPEFPFLDNAYRNTVSGISFIWTGATWAEMVHDGEQGPQGIQGLTGATGAQGIQGLTGATGATGSQGIQGLTGATGEQGPQGIQGLTGATGIQGVQGIQGLTGATGAQGIQGLTGEAGATGTAIVWLGQFPTAPANPSFDNTYRNTMDGRSYIWTGTIWDVMTHDGNDGTNGISIIWLGSFTTAPNDPQPNNAYRNTVDGIAYIWDGVNWTEMVQDGGIGPQGIQGIQGNQGPIGLSMVWIGTYSYIPTGTATNDAYRNSADRKSYIWTGTAWQEMNQDGATGPAGSTTNLDYINFNTGTTAPAHVNGNLFYDSELQTLAVQLGTDVTLQIGQEDFSYVKNITGTVILDGKAVYISGVDNGTRTIALARADSSDTSWVLGVTTTQIPNNGYGYVCVRGYVNNLNTTSHTVNEQLYLSAVTAGEMQATPPDAPNYKVRICRVLTSDLVNGRINIRLNDFARLEDLSDVTVGSVVVNQVLGWNGVNWTNSNAFATSAGPGTAFYPDVTAIIPSSNQNSFSIETINKYPVNNPTHSLETIVVTAATSPVISGAYLYNTPLNRTTIDAGTWDFEFYASVSSVGAGRVSSILRNLYKVITGTGTATTTGTAGTTSRTLTASTDAPFANVVASANRTLASFIQTPKGLYQVTAKASDTQVTILVPATYTNEGPVAYEVWELLFGAQTAAITALTTNYSQYTTLVSEPSYTINSTDKMGTIHMGISNNNTTIYYTYNYPTRYSHIVSPLAVLHNEMPGLQGGTSNQEYHLTLAQYTPINTTGGLSDHNTILNKQGGMTNEHYHLTASQVLNAGGIYTGTDVAKNTITPAFTTDLFISTDTNKLYNYTTSTWVDTTLVNSATINTGTRTIMLSGAGGWPSTTSGCTGPTKLESATNKQNLVTLLFAPTVTSYAEWSVDMPGNYNAGAIKAKFIWTGSTVATGSTVIFGIQGFGYGTGSLVDQVWGTATEVTCIQTGTNYIEESTECSFTIGGSPGADRPIQFRVYRKGSGETHIGEVRLHSVRLKYGINAYSDG